MIPAGELPGAGRFMSDHLCNIPFRVGKAINQSAGHDVRVVEGVSAGGTRTGMEAGRIGPPPYLSRLLGCVVGCLVGTACGRRYALACLLLVGRAAGLRVRMLRSSAVCLSMAWGPLPVSSRTDGS
ncbi:hypothetical protein ABIE67_001601 [Streptomyces sp. V4I8]